MPYEKRRSPACYNPAPISARPDKNSTADPGGAGKQFR